MGLSVIAPLGGFVLQIACRAVDSTKLHCFLVDPEVELAPDTAFRAGLRGRMPRALALNLDAGASYQKVRLLLMAAIRAVHSQLLLAT
jgi:hypothetical protein